MTDTKLISTNAETPNGMRLGRRRLLHFAGLGAAAGALTLSGCTAGADAQEPTAEAAVDRTGPGSLLRDQSVTGPQQLEGYTFALDEGITRTPVRIC